MHLTTLGVSYKQNQFICVCVCVWLACFTFKKFENILLQHLKCLFNEHLLSTLGIECHVTQHCLPQGAPYTHLNISQGKLVLYTSLIDRFFLTHKIAVYFTIDWNLYPGMVPAC